MKSKLIFSIVILGIATNLAWTQTEKDTTLSLKMEEIILTDLRIEGSFPWSHHKEKATDNDRFQNNVRQLMDRQPGIQSFNGENFAQDVRIAIRGYGSRSAFGIRGIKIYQDGLPLTSPDGTSQLDEISIFDIEAVDVVRSGLAARLGNAGGGTIAFRLSEYFDGAQMMTRINSLGAYDAGFKYGVSGHKAKNVLSINHHYYQGRRDFSNARNTTLLNKTRVEITKKWQIDFMHSAYISPLGRDPGALSADEFIKNRYQANARNVTFDAGESVSGILTSGKSVFEKSDKSTFITGYFYRYRDFTGRLPFLNGGWVDLRRHFGGINNTYEYRPKSRIVFSFGQTLEMQSDRRSLSANNNGVKSTLSADQFEDVLNVALYQQFQYNIKRWHLHQMMRWDFNQYQLRDKFVNSGTNNDIKSYRNINGALGIGYNVTNHLTIFGNLNTTFEMPTLNELSNNPQLTSGFNTALLPETSFQKEIGAKWSLDQDFNIHMSLFHIDVDNQITGYEIKDAPGRTFYRNAAATTRKGIEISSEMKLGAYVSIVLNYSYSQFTFDEFKTGNFDYSGHTQPLIPSHKWNLTTLFNARNWVNTQINGSYNSQMYLDDANKNKSPAFYEVNAALYTGTKISSRLSVGLTANNLFDLMDYSNFRANATLGRYYEAASPMNFSLFVKLVL